MAVFFRRPVRTLRGKCSDLDFYQKLGLGVSRENGKRWLRARITNPVYGTSACNAYRGKLFYRDSRTARACIGDVQANKNIEKKKATRAILCIPVSASKNVL